MVIILMGVSGSGKTTIGNLLSKRTGFPFFDGDDFHPEVNVQKMASGIPLTNQDRVDWIREISDFMNNIPGEHKILACSALNRSIRSLIINGIKEPCYFVFLKGDYDLIKDRMDKREAHYMKSGMLTSQFKTLEEPENTVTIGVDNSPDRICDEIYKAVQEKIKACTEGG